MVDDLKSKIEKIVLNLMISHDEDAVQETVENYFKFMDSLRFIELITTAENEFDIEFESKDLNMDIMNNLDSFITLVSQYVYEEGGNK